MKGLILLSLLVAGSASATETGRVESKQWGHASLSFGFVVHSDPAVQDIYGSKGRFVSKFQAGLVPLSKYVRVELNGWFSFLQYKESQQALSGGESSDWVMFTEFPMGADVAVGIDIAREQPVVPYGGVGLVLEPWREHTSGARWVGYRVGGSAFFGGAFLLDVFEHARSERLDSVSGINDAFFTVEARYQSPRSRFMNGAVVRDDWGLQGWAVTFGVKLAY